MPHSSYELPSENPGVLRQKIVIEQPGSTQGNTGGWKNAWPVFATVRAQIEPQGGSEQLGAAAFEPESIQRITIRYLPGILPAMRINFNGRYFDILNINNLQERNRWMVIMAREGRSHGNV